MTERSHVSTTGRGSSCLADCQPKTVWSKLQIPDSNCNFQFEIWFFYWNVTNILLHKSMLSLTSLFWWRQKSSSESCPMPEQRLKSRSSRLRSGTSPKRLSADASNEQFLKLSFFTWLARELITDMRHREVNLLYIKKNSAIQSSFSNSITKFNK